MTVRTPMSLMGIRYPLSMQTRPLLAPFGSLSLDLTCDRLVPMLLYGAVNSMKRHPFGSFFPGEGLPLPPVVQVEEGGFSFLNYRH